MTPAACTNPASAHRSDLSFQRWQALCRDDQAAGLGELAAHSLSAFRYWHTMMLSDNPWLDHLTVEVVALLAVGYARRDDFIIHDLPRFSAEHRADYLAEVRGRSDGREAFGIPPQSSWSVPQ
jgi:hypothetical protein